MEQEDRLLTVEEAVKRLAIAPSTLKNWSRQGRIKGVKTTPARSGHWRICKREIDTYLRKLDNE